MLTRQKVGSERKEDRGLECQQWEKGLQVIYLVFGVLAMHFQIHVYYFIDLVRTVSPPERKEKKTETGNPKLFGTYNES